MRRPGLLAVLIAVGSVIGGAIHLRLYFDSYRDIPVENVGRSFLLNAVAAFAAAALVLVWNHPLAVLAPLVVADATLVAFGLSRTDQGVFNFTENGWNPSPDAALSVVVEVATAALCVLALVLSVRARAVARSATDRTGESG
jgi:uncharacterized membrane protein